MEDEPTLWEFEDAMRFVSPCTWHTVTHDDGDVTLEGEQCVVEVSDEWVADTKRRIAALNRAGTSNTARLSRLLVNMQKSTNEDELRQGWELFEATLEWQMDDLVEALHAKYE